MKKKKIAGHHPAWKIGSMVLSLLMIFGLGSCGGGNSDPNSLKLEVKPELGDLGKFMTIENKEAVISLSEFSDEGKPCIKIASTLQVKVKEDVASDWGFELDVVILDENMNELTDFGYYDIEDRYDYSVHYLTVGDYRAVMDESDSKEKWDGKASAMWDMMREKGKYIALKPRSSSSKFVPYKGAANSESSEEIDESDEVVAEEVVANSGNEDWDKILDEYDAYCTKLVSYAKKVQAGDMSAMTEYTSLLESAQSLQEKLENAGANLSAAQAARLNKIAAKMANAMW